nr:hypothetical protein Itr_chr08CG00860 [Ipomoea trifida]GMD22988.1 hypothetical protein Iba_chr08bCG0960 [Ipomoea batatas]
MLLTYMKMLITTRTTRATLKILLGCLRIVAKLVPELSIMAAFFESDKPFLLLFVVASSTNSSLFFASVAVLASVISSLSFPLASETVVSRFLCSSAFLLGSSINSPVFCSLGGGVRGCDEGSVAPPFACSSPFLAGSSPAFRCSSAPGF